MNTLTPEQRAAVECKGTTVAIIAGPGAGKTHTLIERIAHDIELGRVDPDTTAIITFTNAAARELEHRLDAAKIPRPSFVGTLHSLCLRILNKSRSTPLTVLDEDTAEGIAKLIIERNHLKTTVEKLRKAITGVGIGLVAAESQQLKLAVTLYQKFLADEGAVDHDLILIEALKLITMSDPGIRALYVDEFQDSSSIDMTIYRALRLDLLFVVGDPDQAIYGFRGGDVGGLLALINEPNASVVYLQDCFRCRPAIAAAADKLIAKNVVRAPKIIRSRFESGGDITAAGFATEEEELAALIADIRAMIADMNNPSDMAVLVRYNRDRLKIAKALSGAGFPLAGDKPREPVDWPLAIATVNLIATPENVISAVAWRVATGMTLKEAFATTRELKASGAPLAPIWTNYGVDEALQAAGVSRESRHRVAELADAVGATTPLAIAYSIRESLRVKSAGINVSTYHSAKGLEWKAVWLPVLDQATTPNSKTAIDVEEERRLVFVAITRAKERVRITWSDTKSNAFTGRVEATGGASQFIKESGL